jgi:hypothetical protein
MFQIHTKKDAEAVREVLHRLISDRDRANGSIAGDTFRLHPKPRRKGVPVTLRGRIVPEREGTLVSAWPFPHWMMIAWFPIWCWFGLQLVHAPTWFIMLGLVVCTISFIIETRRGYDLLREIAAA